MNIKTLALATVAAVGVSGAASAATLSLNGGTAVGSIPANFGVLKDASNTVIAAPADLSAPVTLFDSSSADGLDGLFASSDNPKVLVTFKYVGFEAGNTNSATSMSAGGLSFNNKTSLFGDTISFIQAGGVGTLVDVIFSTLGEKTAPCTLVNGGPYAGNTCQVGFSNIFNGGRSTYAMFGDGVGDSDLDDIVFKITVSEVPLPAAGWMLLAGLGGIAAIKRRKKA